MSGLYALGSMPGPINEILRLISFIFDSIIYSLIPEIFKVIYNLYDINQLFGCTVTESGGLCSNLQTLLKTMKETIYSFLAIVMFFRVAFSLLTMLVDPNKINDREKGAEKLIINIMITLVLIVVVPTGFKIARQVQTKVIEDKMIERVISGDEYDDNARYTLGKQLALSTWSVFLSPTVDSGPTYNAYNNVFNSSDTTILPLAPLFLVLNSVTGLPIVADAISKLTPGINGVLNSLGIGSHYQLSYVFFVSTIVGCYVLWAMIKLLIDIAYRSIKFFVLEILSPIAIISYIDPDSSKKGIFSKWVNEVFKTYISLFVRIFVFALCSVIMEQFSLHTFKGGIISKLIFVLAVVAFVKNAPKLIDSILGTNLSKDGDTKFATDLLKGIGGAAVGATAGGIARGVVAKRVGAPVFKNVVKGAWDSGNKGFAAARKGGIAGMRGVVETGVGAVAGAKKDLGYTEDKDKEREISRLEGKVPQVDQAKKDRTAELTRNNNAAINSMLSEGKAVNGRTYGNALVGDDEAKNAMIKNEAGLAAAEVLHGDSPEYMAARNFVAEKNATATMVNLTYERAKKSYAANQEAYMASSDKASYLVSMAGDNVKTAFTTLESSATREITARGNKVDASGISEKAKFVAQATGKDVVTLNAMSDQELVREYVNSKISSNYGVSLAGHEGDSVESRIEVAVRQVAANEATRVTNMSATQLDTEFTHLNEEAVVAKFEYSLGDMAADAAKATDDASKAKDTLKEFKASAKGAKDKRIDDNYDVADARYKVKELARRQRERNQNNSGNNSGGTV